MSFPRLNAPFRRLAVLLLGLESEDSVPQDADRDLAARYDGPSSDNRVFEGRNDDELS